MSKLIASDRLRSLRGWVVFVVCSLTIMIVPVSARAQTGACCTGGPCVVTSRTSCQTLSGEFLVNQPCSACLGACCSPNGCSLTSAVFGCGFNGGIYLGRGSVCGSCPPIGACCRPTGTCNISTSTSCTTIIGSVFRDGFTCDPGVCPISGACCDASAGVCTTTFQTGCSLTFTPNVACGPVVCPPLGACCRGLECQPTLEIDCTGNHTWAGPNTACGPRNDCCPADHTLNQALSVSDIFAFLNDWFAQSTRADFNRNSAVELQDVFDFLNAWFAGC